MRISDWSSDVCSSDLGQIGRQSRALPHFVCAASPAGQPRGWHDPATYWPRLVLRIGRNGCGSASRRRTDMTTETNSPAFMPYRVTGNGKDANWATIGAAWATQDGKGLQPLRHADPLPGQTIMP